MTKLAWVTDLHFDFLRDEHIKHFSESIAQTGAEAVVVSGDISVTQKLVYHLSLLESVVKRPVYFVLGNHDYYGGSIQAVRDKMKELTNISQYLRYLPVTPYVALSSTTAIVGHDGWYDAQFGNPLTSNFVMNDWSRIHEFVPARGQKNEIITIARGLAHKGVMHVHDAIKAAVKYYSHIVVVTHFPPFKEAHLYKGKVGDDNAQPWYTSKMMGDMLMSAAKAFPNVKFTVLSGHTHGKYQGQHAPNLIVNVGGWQPGERDYGNPVIQGIITVP